MISCIRLAAAGWSAQSSSELTPASPALVVRSCDHWRNVPARNKAPKPPVGPSNAGSPPEMFLRRWVAPGWGAKAAAPAAAADQETVAALQRQLIAHLRRLDEAAGAAASGAPASSAAPQLPRLAVALSTIPDAGRGLFLAAGSPALQPGAIITLYPGLVYDLEQFFWAMEASVPGAEDAFAPSPPQWTSDNHYLLNLRCLGRSFLVDGRPDGLSAQRFAAAAVGTDAPVNTSWLPAELMRDGSSSSGGGGGGGGGSSSGSSGGSSSRNSGSSSNGGIDNLPLLAQAALGHLANHQPSPAANATFDLCPLPATLPPGLLRFVPSLSAGSAEPGLRWVPMLRAVAPVAIPAGEGRLAEAAHREGPQPAEVFVDYGADPRTLGFHW